MKGLVPGVVELGNRPSGWLALVRTARLTARGWWEKSVRAAGTRAKARRGAVKQTREEKETEKLMQAIAKAKAKGLVK